MDSPLDESEPQHSGNINFLGQDFSDLSEIDTDIFQQDIRESSPNINFRSQDFGDSAFTLNIGHDEVESSNIRFFPDDFSEEEEFMQNSPSQFNEHDSEDVQNSDDEINRGSRRHGSFSNIQFASADFSDEDLDFDSDQQSIEGVRNAMYNPPSLYTAHSNPPPRQPDNPQPQSGSSHAMRGHDQDRFIDSLLRDKDAAVTKEDLALFAQVISDTYKSDQRRRIAELQRITELAASEDEDADQERNDAPTSRVQVPRARTKKPRKGSQRELSDLVRKFAFELMKRTKPIGNQKIVPISSVTAEEIKVFLKDPTNPRKGPTKERFILDFNEGSGSASPWNKRATQIFVQEFTTSHPETKGSEASVKKAFATHLFHLKNKFKEYVIYVDHYSRVGDQASLLITNENTVHIARMSRRRSLQDRRMEACLSFLHHPCIKKFESLWRSMPVEAMSGDETDHRDGFNRYIITTLPWRAEWIHEWMLVFDRLHLYGRFSETGRATPGAFPHVRIPSTGERVDRHCITPPIGLPRNFYCPNWLSKQTPEFVASLEMAEEIDLRFSDELIRIALSCKDVTSHKTPPTYTGIPL